MDVRSIKPRVAVVPSNTTPVALSDDEGVRKKYSDLLLDHTHTTQHTPERLKLRKEINDLAAQLGKSNKQVSADIRHYEQAKEGGQTIRKNLDDLGVYSPYWNDYYSS